MTDSDDDALTWAGDDRLQAERGPAPRLMESAPAEGRGSGGAAALLLLGVLGGVALLEAVFWLRGVLQVSIAATIDPGTGSPAEVAAFAANVAGRVVAVAAPLVWFAATVLIVRSASRRLAWLLLGAVLLLPWPFLLGAA